MRIDEGIRIDWTGPGHYWLESEAPGGGQIDLGHCASRAELSEAVAEAVAVGSGEEDWSGWCASRDPDREGLS